MVGRRRGVVSNVIAFGFFQSYQPIICKIKRSKVRSTALKKGMQSQLGCRCGSALSDEKNKRKSKDPRPATQPSGSLSKNKRDAMTTGKPLWPSGSDENN
jgi:hypothetical protein